MEKPEVKKRGGKTVYPWEKLQKKGDFFVLPNTSKKYPVSEKERLREVGLANSCRTRARSMGLKATVSEMVKGGYLCELLEDRKK